MRTLSEVRDFALLAHGTQKYGELPYIVHLDDVAEVADRFELHYAIQIAAYLHDILEDTKVEFSSIRAVFGLEIANLVRLVTDEPGKNRKERHRLTYPKTRTNTYAVALKLCDRIANVESCLNTKSSLISMYQREYPEFKEALHTDGEWTEMWARLDDLLMRGVPFGSSSHYLPSP